MVEELIGVCVQCFGEHIVKGLQVVGQFLMCLPGIDISKSETNKESEQK